jgi:hypothetical protein
MEHYRIYPIHADGSIAFGVSVNCETDDQAMNEAAALMGAHPIIEVWCGTRPVCRMTAAEIAPYRRE